jgi:hypothetical protein
MMCCTDGISQPDNVGGEAMGGAFDPKLRNYNCTGQQVTNALNHVFKNPNTPAFKYAKAHNTFDQAIPSTKGNWKQLLSAYQTAKVNVSGIELVAWTHYLEDLGTGEDGDPGPQQISLIAKIRFDALNNDKGTDTKTHPHGHVQTSPGVIDSPCPMGP